MSKTQHTKGRTADAPTGKQLKRGLRHRIIEETSVNKRNTPNRLYTVSQLK